MVDGEVQCPLTWWVLSHSELLRLVLGGTMAFGFWSGLFLCSERPRRCATVTLVPGAFVTEQAASGLSPRLPSAGVTPASSLSAVALAAGSAPLPPAPAHWAGLIVVIASCALRCALPGAS